VGTLKEFIQLLDESTKKLTSLKWTKIGYIGATGKIGRQVISNLCSQIPADEHVEIVLIGSGSDDSLIRLGGFQKDVLGFVRASNKAADITITVSNSYDAIQGSAIVVCSAGKWPSKEQAEQYQKIDPSGRLAQAFGNAGMIRDITREVQQNCPSALFLVVTNQVDLMCHVARQVAPDMTILGLSGGVDSSRLQQVIFRSLRLRAQGLMIGYHNATMTPLIKSIRTCDDRLVFPTLAGEISFGDDGLDSEFRDTETQKLDEIMSVVKTLGRDISTQQRAGLTSGADTGASMLPAGAIVKLIVGYCFGKDTFVESFNTHIREQEVADHYGVQLNTDLSIPLEIGRGYARASLRIPLLESEKCKMREAQVLFEGDLKLIDRLGNSTD
jgi:malate/lactate dehydrogenase